MLHLGDERQVMATAHEVGLKTTSTIMFGHLDQPHHWYTFAILSGRKMYPCFISMYIYYFSKLYRYQLLIVKKNHSITSRSLWIQGQAFAAIEKFGKGDLWFHRVCSSSFCTHGGLNLSKWLITPFHISFLRCYIDFCKILLWHSYKNHFHMVLLMKHLRSHYELGNGCKEPCHGCVLQPMSGAMSPLLYIVVRPWQGHQFQVIMCVLVSN